MGGQTGEDGVGANKPPMPIVMSDGVLGKIVLSRVSALVLTPCSYNSRIRYDVYSLEQRVVLHAKQPGHVRTSAPRNRHRISSRERSHGLHQACGHAVPKRLHVRTNPRLLWYVDADVRL